MDGFQLLFQWGKFRSGLVNVWKAQSSHLHLHEALLVPVAFPGVHKGSRTEPKRNTGLISFSDGLKRQCRSVSWQMLKSRYRRKLERSSQVRVQKADLNRYQCIWIIWRDTPTTGYFFTGRWHEGVLTLQGKDEGRSAQYKQTADAISQLLPKHVLNDAWARFEQDPEINNVLWEKWRYVNYGKAMWSYVKFAKLRCITKRLASKRAHSIWFAKEDFVIESQNRQQDTAVIEAFNVGDMDDGMFAPLSKEAVGTLASLSQLYTAFCLAHHLLLWVDVWNG